VLAHNRTVRTQSKNILYLLHSFHTKAGTEQNVKTLIRGLASEFNIFVAFPDDGQLVLRLPDGDEFTAPGCPSSWPIAPEQSIQFDDTFDRILALSNPDIIHIHHLNNWPLHTIERLSALKSKKIMTFHDYFALTPLVSGGSSEALLRRAQDMLTAQYATKTFGKDISNDLIKRREIINELIKTLDLRIAPSKFVSETMTAAFDSKFDVIEHGIEPLEASPKVAEPPLRFGFMGSLIPQKGWTILAEAFYKLRETFGDIELHMFGGDASRDIQIPGLKFHGLYDMHSLPKILSQFHIGVIPSNFAETYCLTLSELWMAKIPVIAARIGALKDRVIENVNGVFFQPGDVQDLITKMEWFCTHDDWRTWQLPVPRLAKSMVDDYRQIYSQLGSSESV
jgi:glycosyltransferase involved in cell wall biosynthesis